VVHFVVASFDGCRVQKVDQSRDAFWSATEMEPTRRGEHGSKKVSVGSELELGAFQGSGESAKVNERCLVDLWGDLSGKASPPVSAIHEKEHIKKSNGASFFFCPGFAFFGEVSQNPFE